MAARRRYAQDTKVPVEQTRIEIERLLKKYGADQFMSGEEVGRAVLGFRMKGLQIRMSVALPKKDENARDRKERRRIYRALLMIIKAKLEAVESGISLLEHEFLGDTVMANGQTVAEWAVPQVADMYATGAMPGLLPPPPPRSLPAPAAR